MENAKVLALRVQVREAVGADRIAQILDRPKPEGSGTGQRVRIRQPVREKPTPGQLRVINAISHGLTIPDAALVLGISYETAKTHIRNAKPRCAAKTTASLVAICLREGWIH